MLLSLLHFVLLFNFEVIYIATLLLELKKKINPRKGKNGEIQLPGPIHSYAPSVWTKKRDMKTGNV